MDIPDWTLRRCPSETAASLEKAGCSRLFARILASRGVDAASLGDYLEPVKGEFANLEELPGAIEAAREILQSVKAKNKIVVFGDYDCDGISATAILIKTIKAVGGDVYPFIPLRLSEGYGMTSKSLARMLETHPDVKLVVTVDNGINSVEETSMLKSRGIDVVVTDHHLPGDSLPECTVVNPKTSDSGRLEWLCGSGVAFFVAHALMKLAVESGMYEGKKISAPLLVLAGIATVTDIMPLKGQNRMLVARALSLFQTCAPIGLRELMERAARTGREKITAKDFGFLIGPRMNADGRLAHGTDALELLLCDDREIAREYARIIDLRNTERKQLETSMMECAIPSIVPRAPAQVIEIPDGHIGVAGIVAARILERISSRSAPVPVAVVVGTHGSARAPDGFNVRDALEKSSAHLVRFGGHAPAGGFSVKEGEIGLFRKAFCEACAGQSGAIGPSAGKPVFDAWVESKDLTLDFAMDLAKMEPFGEGNPEPVFAMAGVRLSSVRPFGQQGRHLLVEFSDKSIPRATWWNHGQDAEKFRANASKAHDVLFTVEISSYGKVHVELRIADMRPA